MGTVSSKYNLKSTMYVELSLYLGLGLAVLLVWDTVIERMHHGELSLIAGESSLFCRRQGGRKEAYIRVSRLSLYTIWALRHRGGMECSVSDRGD